ncbi:MAG: 30S ribosomal protein S8 [Proteobacteria bacterium]|nr:MAG: 30S ribosomal protein S8 [Pseudomonadota bacterium]
MSNDLIADCLTRIRNAQRAGHKSVHVRQTKMVARVLEVLKSEGYIESYEIVKERERGESPRINVVLKYYTAGEPVISQARRVSKSGRRFYVKGDKLPRIASGLGMTLVSTSQGVLSDREARKRKIGGEVLATIS